jgi:hypothetical protein
VVAHVGLCTALVKRRTWVRFPHTALLECRKEDMSNFVPLRRRAIVALHRALRNGIVIKPKSCERCGKTPQSRDLHGHHHHGYDEKHWLDVEWLCASCHLKVRCETHPNTNEMVPKLPTGATTVPSEQRRRAAAKTPTEIRSARTRQQMAALTPQERSAIGSNASAAFVAKYTHEERSAQARRSAETLRQRRRNQTEGS